MNTEKEYYQVTKDQFKKEHRNARLWLRRSYESMRYLPCGADDAMHEKIQWN